MSGHDELVYVNCCQLQTNGFGSKRNASARVCLFEASAAVGRSKGSSPCRHPIVPTLMDSVIKCGAILKMGSRSGVLANRCAVLLPDRLVIYNAAGDDYAIVLFLCM